MTITAVEPHALNMHDAVAYSGLSRSRLYQLFAEKRIKSFQVGGRRMVLRAELQAFLDAAART